MELDAATARRRTTAISRHANRRLCADATPWQANYQCLQLLSADHHARSRFGTRPDEAALVQSPGAQPNPDPIMHQHLDAVAASISKQVRMMRACFAKHAHYARQRRLRAGAHVQRLDRQPHCFDADHRSSSPNHAPQAAAAASGQLSFTTVDPRRSSITVSCDVTTGDLCTSTGTNAAFAGIALAGATLRPAIGPVSWTARSAATTQRRKRLAFKR